jgi:ABC-2 type transport system ATP-binding protein
MKRKVLTAENLRKSYRKKEVLRGLSLSIRQGEIFGLLGPNGAGKSTFTKIATGLEKPDSGEIKYFNKPLAQNLDEVKRKIAVIPQEESFYREFSVEENIAFFGRLYGLRGQELKKRVDHLLEWLELKPFKKMPARYLSGGYRRLLNTACSLVHDPKMVFMDEPTVALDPGIRQMYWKKIKELKKEGKTICLTTHYMDEAEKLSDRIALIVKGKILVQGSPQKLVKKYAKPLPERERGPTLEDVFLNLTGEKVDIRRA